MPGPDIWERYDRAWSKPPDFDWSNLSIHPGLQRFYEQRLGRRDHTHGVVQNSVARRMHSGQRKQVPDSESKRIAGLD
jgi:hypothetical protein